MLDSLLPANGLAPHGYCLAMRPGLIWTHVISDATIALAYFMIPVVLVYFIRRSRYKLSFAWAIALFAVFIVLCGTGHLIEIATIWTPVYYLQGYEKAATAVISIATALAILPLVPKLLAMRPPEELEAANAQLRAEVKEREKAEASLRRSMDELNRALTDTEQFAYIASHDLQAPLRGIAGFSQLLSKRHAAALPEEAREFLGEIDRGARQMQQLIRDLLALTRIDRVPARFEPACLDQTVDRACKALSAEIRRTHAEVVCDAMPEVVASHELLAQLFQNLISNSIKFQSRGNSPRVRIRAIEEGDQWHLVVADNGIGIPSDQLEGVFAMFRRLHSAEEYEGTGIGLAICRKVAGYHGGRIYAVPSPQGAEVHLILPRAPLPPTSASRVAFQLAAAA